MHEKCRIISLEQRRRIQLLLLMHKKNKDVTMHKVFSRNTRQSNRLYSKLIIMRVLYISVVPILSVLNFVFEIIDTPDLYTFKTRLK